MIFSCNPINAFNVLKGDPGEYSACKLLSKSGFPMVSLSYFLKYSDLSLPVSKLGLKLGAETKDSISPV